MFSENQFIKQTEKNRNSILGLNHQAPRVRAPSSYAEVKSDLVEKKNTVVEMHVLFCRQFLQYLHLNGSQAALTHTFTASF